MATSKPPLPATHPVAGSRVLALVDGVAWACARLGDVLLVLITVFLTYEVVARYVFFAPTKWTQDVSIVLQIWFAYLGMAFVLRQRQMIRITALLTMAGPALRRIAEGFSLAVIAAFCLVAVIYGWDIMMDSIRLGRRQPTMLEMPNWIGELPVIVGFALLFVQAVADLIRLPFRPAPEFSPAGEHGPAEDDADAASGTALGEEPRT